MKSGVDLIVKPDIVAVSKTGISVGGRTPDLGSGSVGSTPTFPTVVSAISLSDRGRKGP